MVRRHLRRVRSILRRDIDVHFLPHVSGVIHVGANVGQERKTYEDYRLRVAWVEPIPAVFAALQNNIARFPRQRAFEYLVTDRDGASCLFHIANNEGASSSILDLAQHKDIWPEVAYSATIELNGITLPSLIERERIVLADYDALVLDTQGSELLVLSGAAPILGSFSYIKVEAPDFESYSGCCRIDDLAAFLGAHGFRERLRRKFAERREGGTYYDVLYERDARSAS